ncbi:MULTISPECIES: YggT family protein [Actinomyces]|uniref:YggT family protein n=1 Tax=Actinomyces TaxID=1654 RepID=UPI000930FFC5|nr:MULTISPECIES: YggT family protein [Actinomyces]
MVFLWLGGAIALLAGLYMLVLIARMIFDWIRILSPLWRPRGIILLLANVIYFFTDPPLKFLRKMIPPVRLGGNVAIDTAFLIVFLVTILCENLGVFIRSFGV